MKTPVPEYLTDLLDEVRDQDGGDVAGYIPELAAADAEVFGIGLSTVDGRTYSAGDDDVEFSIQSISKPFAYAAALADRGFEQVLAKVGVEPSGEAFNELSLEQESHRPKNPMINAGAITVHHLLGDQDSTRDERVARALDFFSELAGRRLRIDEAVYESETSSADRNLAIAHMLRTYGIIDEQTAHEVVDGYTAQCSVAVTVRDLAVMGSTFANAGVHPVTGRRIVAPAVARQTLSALAASGMYDAAGSWFADIGIPAKSGVSGGLLGMLPGQVSMSVLSPRLDEHGNSVRGVKTFQGLSNDMGLHLMDAEPYGSSVLRSIGNVHGETIVELQGVVQFTGAENLLAALEDDDTSTPTVVFDLSRVDRLLDVGRRMVLEAMRRVKLDGRTIVLHDPDRVLPNRDLGDGTYPGERR